MDELHEDLLEDAIKIFKAIELKCWDNINGEREDFFICNEIVFECQRYYKFTRNLNISNHKKSKIILQWFKSQKDYAVEEWGANPLSSVWWECEYLLTRYEFLNYINDKLESYINQK